MGTITSRKWGVRRWASSAPSSTYSSYNRNTSPSRGDLVTRNSRQSGSSRLTVAIISRSRASTVSPWPGWVRYRAISASTASSSVPRRVRPWGVTGLPSNRVGARRQHPAPNEEVDRIDQVAEPPGWRQRDGDRQQHAGGDQSGRQQQGDRDLGLREGPGEQLAERRPPGGGGFAGQAQREQDRAA